MEKYVASEYDLRLEWCSMPVTLPVHEFDGVVIDAISPEAAAEGFLFFDDSHARDASITDYGRLTVYVFNYDTRMAYVVDVRVEVEYRYHAEVR